MHISNEVLAALITGTSSIVVALITRIGRGISKKIDGLKNGTRTRALEEIDRLHRARVLKGLPVRRDVDRLIAQEDERAADER